MVWVLRLVLVALGTAAYVGLAILGWGGFWPFSGFLTALQDHERDGI
jgi:hypothetical protein